MAHPPHPQQPDPHGSWGHQGQQGYGPPPGQSAPPPGHGPPHAQGPPPHGQGAVPHGQGQPPYGQGAGPYGQGQPPYGQGQPPYGQGAGPYGQGYDQGAGPYGQGQPPYGQNQGQYGYGNQMGAPSYGSPPPGDRNNKALLISVIVVLSGLLIGGGAYGAYAFLGAPGPAPTLIAQPTTSPSAPPTSAPPSSTPPSAPPSATPSDSPEPSSTPSGSADEPLEHSEFGDWNFSLKGEKYAARKVGGWTYDSCDPVDAEGVMADNNCENAVQLAYTAYGGNLKAVQIILAFPSSGDTKNAAKQLKNTADKNVAWRRSSAHRSYSYGKIYTGAYVKHLVITIVTANSSAKPKAAKFHTALQTDRGVYFFMGRRQTERPVTS
ncbi:hypothetical protein FE391_36270 [Nonomuraea sp. KC401]|uniref:hypothetical protein n=1 Tax=unclassified Nonomuraea TaxID=2593643 RepID=UPI0010FF0C51|nr:MULTISPECIES: hypothetical protein [unclassified Nonomuraea]NBE99045.1 hypothetical protein [Nonomuraea sp. K271]TLF58556.1 hypothetical protein FE391_36270 [Nonomuraea sp. KC401]